MLTIQPGHILLRYDGFGIVHIMYTEQQKRDDNLIDSEILQT